MLNIYVLEDHFIQQNRIEEVIHTILKKNNIKVGDFEVFDKPNQLLDSITERGSHQLFFLDIQIKDDTKKGLEVAKQIRKNDPYASIVFFTTHSEYLPLTFQYQLVALDFIDTVSYTHLDVYKRQPIVKSTQNELINLFRFA